MTLRTRIAMIAAVCVALAIGAMAVVGYVLFDRESHRQLDVGLARETGRIETQIRAGRWDPSLASACEWLAEPACAQVVTAGSAGAALPVTEDDRAVAAGLRGEFTTDRIAGGRPVRVRTTPLRAGEALQVGIRADGVPESLERIRRTLLVAGIGGVVVAAALGYLVARTSLRPLARITGVTSRIAATGDPSDRVAVRGGDELAQLAGHINTMLATLDDSITAQRRLVADASHELRTPLTVLRSDIDLLRIASADVVARRRILERLRGQGAELSRLVDDLIELARGDETAYEIEDVALHEVVEHGLRLARRHWPAITFTEHLEPTIVRGTPHRLERAIGNLLDNAAKFSPPDGTVTVDLAGAELIITDRGPGIPAEDQPRVFDRFYRAPGVRDVPGSGLGLAIVAQVVRAHDATIQIESQSTGGTRIVVRFLI